MLAEWRRVDNRHEEVARKSSEKPVSSLMQGVMEGLRLDQRQSELEIISVWNTLLDPNLTAHAQPTGIHKGTLFVKVDNNVWLDEIVRYRRHEILKRLQTAFGRTKIQKVSYSIG